MSSEQVSYRVWNAFTALGAAIGVVVVLGTLVTLLFGGDLEPRTIVFYIGNIAYLVFMPILCGIGLVAGAFVLLGWLQPRKTTAGIWFLIVLALLILGWLAWFLAAIIGFILNWTLVDKSEYWHTAISVLVIVYLAWAIAWLRQRHETFRASQTAHATEPDRRRPPARARRGRIIERQRRVVRAAARSPRTTEPTLLLADFNDEFDHGVRMVLNTLASWRRRKAPAQQTSIAESGSLLTGHRPAPRSRDQTRA